MRKAKLHPHFFGNNSLLETAQYLTFYSLQLPFEYNNKVYLNLKITAQKAEKIIILFEKRISERIPVEYLTHEAYYLGNTFFVNENVLIPRSIMNTRFKDFLAGISWENHHVLDLCTGSGCIGISLALLHPFIKVDLVDISPKALEVASINIQKYSLQDRVRCIQSDLFE
ncbi:MAG: HemK family protein methyltransferase, partial [Gammaproteobacteria bacterium]|nr:HemK family protein methyltransferase [Gammaproteobacteria bacterium]